MPELETVSRKEHLQEFGHLYQPGMHVSGFGPTGRGKSRLFYQQLAVVCSPDLQVISLHGKVKGRDKVISAAAKQCNLRVVRALPSPARQAYDRKTLKKHGYLIVPIGKAGMSAADEERLLKAAYAPAIHQNYGTTKRKTITHVNEAHQTQVDLKLKQDVEAPLMRGGPDNAVWQEAQRGSHLSYHTYGAPEIIEIWYDPVKQNRERYKEIGCADPDEIEYYSQNLKRERVADGRTISQCLFITRNDGLVYIVDT
jgi:hypothetical protein